MMDVNVDIQHSGMEFEQLQDCNDQIIDVAKPCKDCLSTSKSHSSQHYLGSLHMTICLVAINEAGLGYILFPTFWQLRQRNSRMLYLRPGLFLHDASPPTN